MIRPIQVSLMTHSSYGSTRVLREWFAPVGAVPPYEPVAARVASLHVLPAVDRDIGAGHEAGIVGAQVDNQCRHFLGLAETPHRDMRKHRGAHIICGDSNLFFRMYEYIYIHGNISVVILDGKCYWIVKELPLFLWQCTP